MRVRLGLATLLGVLLVAGCGGSGSTAYNRPAFVVCLQQQGVRTFGTGDMTSAEKAVLVHVIGSGNFVAAVFPGGEEDAFIFALDGLGANKIVDKLKAFAKTPIASAGHVESDGNLVLITPVHSTTGVQKIISSCKSDAKRT